jgi:ribosome-associated heat shock protein Hsp15
MSRVKTTKKKATAEPAAAKQRIDRWLWHVRVVKTRRLAAMLVASGHVRINGRRVENPSHPVGRDDVLTVALPGIVRVLRVIGFAERRTGAAGATGLYENVKAPGHENMMHLLAPPAHMR